MRTVLRLAVNARVSLLDPAGVEHRGVIDRYERDRAVIRVESSSPSASRPRIILAAAIVKGPRMDFVVEKAAELGASELWPLVCARGLVRAPGAERLARWRRLALSAAKQSQSPAAMEVRAPVGIDDMIRGVPPAMLAVVCAQGSDPLGEVIRRAHPRGILIAVGPEGDFDERRARASRDRGIRRGRTWAESPQERDGGSGSGQHSGRGYFTMRKEQAKMPKRNKAMARKFAFIMDPLERVLVDKDTTFVFMLEAQFRGHEIYFLGLRDLYARGQQVIARVRQCELTRRGNPHYKFLDDGVEYPLETFRRRLHAQGSARRRGLSLRDDAAEPGRRAANLRAQQSGRPARGQRKALLAEFSRRDSADARDLRNSAAQGVSRRTGRRDDRQAARRTWRRRRVPRYRRRIATSARFSKR